MRFTELCGLDHSGSQPFKSDVDSFPKYRERERKGMSE